MYNDDYAANITQALMVSTTPDMQDKIIYIRAILAFRDDKPVIRAYDLVEDYCPVCVARVRNGQIVRLVYSL